MELEAKALAVRHWRAQPRAFTSPVSNVEFVEIEYLDMKPVVRQMNEPTVALAYLTKATATASATNTTSMPSPATATGRRYGSS
jgi:hypothetical protein